MSAGSTESAESVISTEGAGLDVVGVHSREDPAFFGLLPTVKELLSADTKILRVRLLRAGEATGVAVSEMIGNAPRGHFKFVRCHGFSSEELLRKLQVPFQEGKLARAAASTKMTQDGCMEFPCRGE